MLFSNSTCMSGEHRLENDHTELAYGKLFACGCQLGAQAFELFIFCPQLLHLAKNKFSVYIATRSFINIPLAQPHHHLAVVLHNWVQNNSGGIEEDAGQHLLSPNFLDHSDPVP